MRDGIETTFLTTSAAARRLGIGRATLARAARRGEILPAYSTAGGDPRFHPADVDAFAAGRARAARDRRSAFAPERMVAEAARRESEAASALDTARRAADKRAAAFAILLELSVAFAAEREPHALCWLAVAQLVDRFGYDLVSIYMRDGDTLRPRAQLGYDTIFDPLPIQGKGVTARAMRTGATQFVPDVAVDAEYLAGASGIVSEICVPILVGGRAEGILNVESRTPGVLDQEIREFMELMARQLAISLENVALREEEGRRADRLAAQAEAMATIGAALSGALEPEQLYSLILTQAVRLVPSDQAEVLLYEDGWATVAATWGTPALPVGTRIFPVAGPDRPWMPPDQPGAVYLADTDTDPDWETYPPFVGAHRIRSILAAPLVVDGVVVGSLHLHSSMPGYYEEQHLPLATAFAERVCQALRNARLYRAERERRLAAEALAQMRNDFLGAVSHELRTPLTAMVGFAELLRDRWRAMGEPQRQGYLDWIVTSANRQRRIVEDLLETSHVEAGMLQCARAVFPLRPLLERAADEVRTLYPGQRIDLDGAEDILVECDADRALQIVINLIDNAAKYSPEGSPVTLCWDRADERVAVRVRDHGPGIPEASRETLFTRFGRLPGSKARAGRTGTGLGLYLSRLLAEAMAGDIALETSGPGGSTFLLRLPAPSAETSLVCARSLIEAP